MSDIATTARNLGMSEFELFRVAYIDRYGDCEPDIIQIDFATYVQLATGPAYVHRFCMDTQYGQHPTAITRVMYAQKLHMVPGNV